MKKILYTLALVLIVLAPHLTSAQNINTLTANAGDDRNVLVNRQIVFSAVNSTSERNTNLSFRWDFGDGNRAEGLEVSHSYRTPGTYKVRLTVSDGQSVNTDEALISVEKDIVLLLTDQSIDPSKITALREYASSQNVLLINIANTADQPGYIIEKQLAQQFWDNKEDVKLASSIIAWTNGTVGQNALIEAAQSLTNLEDPQKSTAEYGWQNKNLIIVNDQSLSVTKKIGQNLFDLLKPRFVIIAKEPAINSLAGTTDTDKLIGQLKSLGAEYQIIGVHSQIGDSFFGKIGVMSQAVQYMVNQGVALNTIFLILIVPIIATIIAFARQIIGLKTFGIYPSTIITLSFLATGWKLGLLFFIIILSAGTITRVAGKRIRLLYMPRMALVLIIISLVIFFLLFIGTVLNQPTITNLSIFPILLLVVLTEKFIAAQIDQGSQTAVKLTVETLALSIVCYFVASWGMFRTLLLGYPELVLLTILINFLIGRWSGLRLIEYIRFRDIINHAKQNQPQP